MVGRYFKVPQLEIYTLKYLGEMILCLGFTLNTPEKQYAK
jgi:hypothetical protein